MQIPERGSGSWILTSVYRQKVVLDKVDGPGRPLRCAIRALKVWRNHHRVEIHSYGIETIAIVLVAGGHVRRSVESIVLGVLEWLSAIPQRRALACSLFDHDDDEPGRYAACAFDPAVPKNNVLAQIPYAECRKIATRARKALERLMEAKDCLDEGDWASSFRLLEEAFALDERLILS